MKTKTILNLIVLSCILLAACAPSAKLTPIGESKSDSNSYEVPLVERPEPQQPLPEFVMQKAGRRG